MSLPVPLLAMSLPVPMLAKSLPVAQWLERPTGVRKVMGSNPVGDSDFSLSHARDMLNIPSFLMSKRLQKGASVMYMRHVKGNPRSVFSHLLTLFPRCLHCTMRKNKMAVNVLKQSVDMCRVLLRIRESIC